MLKHPKGLFVLFFTEMWERFSFYGMRAILVLFLIAQVEDGGFGWDKPRALTLYGIYTALVYIMSIPGGIVADRWLGQRKSVMVGGLLLCAGHLLMAYTEPWAFYGALALIILGVGLLKPNISTMVGGLYHDGDPRRDSGFTIFYMGINLGALLSTLIVGYVGERIGWHYGFSLAGFGMLIGQTIFIVFRKHVMHVGSLTRDSRSEQALSGEKFTRKDWDRILILAISFIIVIVFWMSFEQAGGLMTIYAKEYSNRFILGWKVPASMLQSLNPGYILLFGGVLAFIWQYLGRKGKDPSSIFKMGLGTVIMGIGFLFMVQASIEHKTSTDHLSSISWIFLAYLFHTLGELCLSPVSLSFITKVAPKRIVASMMGIYFATTGLANFLAAFIGRYSEKLGETTIFLGLFIIPVTLGLILMLFSKKLIKLTHGIEK